MEWGFTSTIKRLATEGRDASFPQQINDMAGTAAKIENLGRSGSLPPISRTANSAQY